MTQRCCPDFKPRCSPLERLGDAPASGFFSVFGIEGGPEAHPNDWEERETLRHGAAVPADLVPADTQCPLLHVAGRALDVTA